MTDNRLGHVDVYAVGWLAALRRGIGPIRQELSYTTRKIRTRDWHSIRCSLSGYLAEPTDWPPGLRRCGTGWTAGRALKDLRRRMSREGFIVE